VSDFPHAGHDRFIVRQRFRLVRNRYDIYVAERDGREGEHIGIVDQKLAALREDLRAYAPDDPGRELFRIKARRIFDPAARYEVTDGNGAQIGELGKQFKASLLRSTWRIYTPDGTEIAWTRERNVAVALFRRLKGLAELVPFVGWVAGWLIDLLPIPYHFDFFVGERRIGGFNRLLALRDRYLLDLSGDVERAIDRRVALALAVGMDALQAR
jgi:uncharacterized protein YxjI